MSNKETISIGGMLVLLGFLTSPISFIPYLSSLGFVLTLGSLSIPSYWLLTFLGSVFLVFPNRNPEIGIEI